MKSTQQFAEEVLVKHNVTLTSEYKGAHEKVTFLCPNGHENEATATNLLQRGYKCKECITGYKVKSKNTWTKEILEPYLNLPSSEIAVILKTTKSAIDNAIKDLGLSNSKEVRTREKLVEVLKYQERTLIEGSGSSHTLATIRCSNNHQVQQLVSNVIYKNTGCPLCTRTTSEEEQSLIAFIKEHYDGWVIENDRSLIFPQELDIILPDLGLAIEYNGTYWHATPRVHKNYHKNKSDAVEAEGFQLIHINSYDYQTKPEQVKHRLLSKLNKLPKLAARKTVFKEIPYPKAFLDKYHLQGAGQPTKHNYGLFYNNDLVAVMTFNKSRFTDHDYELVRFCSSMHIQGGASKLFSNAPLKGTIISYADRDYSNGNMYKQLGFTYQYTTEPGYALFNKLHKVSRYQAQGIEQDLLDKGYYRVYNSGNLVFTTLK